MRWKWNKPHMMSSSSNSSYSQCDLDDSVICPTCSLNSHLSHASPDYSHLSHASPDNSRLHASPISCHLSTAISSQLSIAGSSCRRAALELQTSGPMSMMAQKLQQTKICIITSEKFCLSHPLTLPESIGEEAMARQHSNMPLTSSVNQNH